MLLLAAGSSGGRDEPSVARLIEQLRHEQYEVRQAAEERLVELGPAALAARGRATKDPLPEVWHRAKRALKTITKPSATKRAAMRKQAEDSFKRGYFEQMLQHYGHLALLDDANYKDHLWLGHAQQLLDDWPASVKAYRQALRTLHKRHERLLTRQLDAEAKRVEGQRARGADAAAQKKRREQFELQIRRQKSHQVGQRAMLLLLIGQIQREVLADPAAAARSFAEATRGVDGADSTIDDLVARWENNADQPVKQTNRAMHYPLLALRELAETQARRGQIRDAIDTWSRHNLLGKINNADTVTEIDYVGDLARRLTDASPPIHGLFRLGPDNPEAHFDLADPAVIARAYRVDRSGQTRRFRFALLPPHDKEFATLQLSCDTEQMEGRSPAPSRCWARASREPAQQVAIGNIGWPDDAPPGRMVLTERLVVPPGLGMLHLEAMQWDGKFAVHHLDVEATFRPRSPDAEPPPPARLQTEMVQGNGRFTDNGQAAAYNTPMQVSAGTHLYTYEVPGRPGPFRAEMKIVPGAQYGLFINLDSPFDAKLTNLRSFSRDYSADSTLARLPNGNWLTAFTSEDYSQIRLSTSADLVRWDDAWELPFNTLCKTVAPCLLADDQGGVWLAYFSNRLHLQTLGTHGYRLWLTRTTDGRHWERPRPLRFGRFGNLPATAPHMVRHPNGTYWVFWRDFAGSAESMVQLEQLTSLGFRKHKLAPLNPHVSIGNDGVFHMVFAHSTESIHYCHSTDGRQWSDPVKLNVQADQGALMRPQLILDASRAALLYETGSGAWLRTGRLLDQPVLGDPLKIAGRVAPLSGSRVHRVDKLNIAVLAGSDAVWLLRTPLEGLW